MHTNNTDQHCPANGYNDLFAKQRLQQVTTSHHLVNKYDDAKHTVVWKYKDIYLDISEVDIVILEEADEFHEVLFCWVVMTTVRPNSLR